MLVGINSIAETSLSIYPNPAKDFVSFESTQPFEEKDQIKLFTMDGKLVLFTSFNSLQKNSKNYTLLLPKLSNGMYFITIQTSRQSKTEKIIIQ
jgi:hypothetical protein